MSRESVRQAIVGLIEARKATWSDYTLIIEYDNRLLVDTQTQHNPFLRVGITYFDGEQIDLGSQNHRDQGLVVVSAVVREGEGSAKANALLDHFVPSLQQRSIGALRLWGSRPHKDSPHLGWVYYPVAIPFEADTLF